MADNKIVKIVDEELNAKTKTQEKKQPEAKCCEDCLKWEAFGENCWVYWKGKKHCTLKADNSDELSNVNILMRI
ncbi:MAG TPA: hypothetical protein VI894_00320 [Candidatus Nanoarchaeia archaeon]|nr:hypothetical protein [Candidatus Nanoarchaeia archaeon]